MFCRFISPSCPFQLLTIVLLVVSLINSCATSSLSPPKDPPDHLLQQYTLNNQIPLERFYIDDTNSGVGSHYIYSSQQILSMINNSLKMFQKIQQANDAFVKNQLNNGQQPSMMLLKQLRKEDWIYYALLNYTTSLQNSQVGVIGSSSPWMESLLLALGVANVTTVEYNQLTYHHPQIQTISFENFEEFYATSRFKFDFIFSISSFDHDGLGRYGDPLSPSGDIESMSRIKSLLKPTSGRLFLTIPIGPDVIVWNLHRRYGRIRLPLLLDGWDIVDRIGWEEEKLDKVANWRQTYEPVFILTPLVTTIGEERRKENEQENEEEEEEDEINDSISSSSEEEKEL